MPGIMYGKLMPKEFYLLPPLPLYPRSKFEKCAGLSGKFMGWGLVQQASKKFGLFDPGIWLFLSQLSTRAEFYLWF